MPPMLMILKPLDSAFIVFWPCSNKCIILLAMVHVIPVCQTISSYAGVSVIILCKLGRIFMISFEKFIRLRRTSWLVVSLDADMKHITWMLRKAYNNFFILLGFSSLYSNNWQCLGTVTNFWYYTIIDSNGIKIQYSCVECTAVGRVAKI